MKSAQKKRGNISITMPSCDPEGQMWKYLVKKNEKVIPSPENDDVILEHQKTEENKDMMTKCSEKTGRVQLEDRIEKKLTFKAPPKNKMSNRIEMFQRGGVASLVAGDVPITT